MRRYSDARVRPILITAITTIVAMIPLAMGKEEEVSVIGAPFAITVIGGLTAALECARQGFAVEVFEQASSAQERLRHELSQLIRSVPDTSPEAP